MEPTPPPADPLSDAAHLRTAWHPLLILLLELLLPRDLWHVVAEYALTREPRRIDAVVVRRVGVTVTWHAEYLRSLLDDLHEHNLVHFKGATDALERADALQLLSYAYQYMTLEGLESPGDVALRVVAPTLTARFRAQLEVLGGVLAGSDARGVHVGMVQGFALRVVETSVAWPNPGEHLLYAVSPACLQTPAQPRVLDDREQELYYHLLQGITQLTNDPRWKAIMKDATLVKNATSQALLDLLAVIPPELRRAAITPDDLASLSEADRVLALPDTALRALPADYLATLPEDAQARIRTRLGR